MKQLCCSCLLWLGVLQATFSHEKEGSRRRKLCGRYLLIEIIKLCGQTDWKQFELEDQTPLTRLAPAPHLSKKVKTFIPDQSPSSTWRGFTNSAPVPASHKKAVYTWEHQPAPDYQFEKANLFQEKTRQFSPLGVNPYAQSIKIQQKNRNKINTFSSLFGGNHPQRKRRSFSDKCCLKGCTKEELAVACLPYVDLKNLTIKQMSLVTELYTPS
ncbi:insulin-like peptide INSL6 [Onychomys torridus]|uniref:insulin-like peptide INSL6 n=1 Tax=Onychomys torridus TaxID=38674 RepID=UPI00167FAAA0|nr:insulin-like peptide INSL6 [Onychomys torridus]